MTPGTRYEFYVKDSCSIANVSPWVGPTEVVTLCAISTAPWSENFDNGNWQSGTGANNTGNLIAPCWNRPTTNNPDFGTRSGPTGSAGTGPSSDVSGSGNYLFTEASGGAQGTGEVSSPMLVIPASFTMAQLSFRSHLLGAGIDSLVVEVDDGTGFNPVYSLVGAQQTAPTDPWQLNTIDISAYSGDTVQIRFLGTNSNFEGDIAIDEVSIKDLSCPAR
ncbi:MAG: hypothetical protein U5L96_04825 [Owenweeksia sp.]|nr:hypothetical protein [Owenweeksia sp.]